MKVITKDYIDNFYLSNVDKLNCLARRYAKRFNLRDTTCLKGDFLHEVYLNLVERSCKKVFTVKSEEHFSALFYTHLKFCALQTSNRGFSAKKVLFNADLHSLTASGLENLFEESFIVEQFQERKSVVVETISETINPTSKKVLELLSEGFSPCQINDRLKINSIVNTRQKIHTTRKDFFLRLSEKGVFEKQTYKTLKVTKTKKNVEWELLQANKSYFMFNAYPNTSSYEDKILFLLGRQHTIEIKKLISLIVLNNNLPGTKKDFDNARRYVNKSCRSLVESGLVIFEGKNIISKN